MDNTSTIKTDRRLDAILAIDVAMSKSARIDVQRCITAARRQLVAKHSHASAKLAIDHLRRAMSCLGVVDPMSEREALSAAIRRVERCLTP